MRALVLALATLLSGQMALSQRARPSYENSGAMPDSPVIHSDRRVTFSIIAPGASEVLLAGGDLGAVLGGAQALKKNDDGMWTITVGPIEPGIYDYGFAIDGGIRTVDPANTNVVERTWGHTNYLEVPGGSPNVASIRAVPRGTLHLHHYDSKSLGATRRLRVYTPPGYESGEERYPVLYLLHGSGGIDSQWTTVGRANFIMDNLIADDKARPMIVVMPWGHVPKPAGDGRGRTANDGFDKDLLNDVMPLVERNYRALPGRENRAIAGLSMGGGQSLQIGLANLDRFSSVASFSGAVRDLSQFEGLDATELNAKIDVFWIGCGNTDFLFEANQNFDHLLTRKRIDHFYRVTEGGHTWANWRLYLSEFAPLLFQQIRPSD